VSERDKQEASYWRGRVAAMSDEALLRWVRGIARAKLRAGERIDPTEIRWCETHKAQGIEDFNGMSDECWPVVWADGWDFPRSDELCRVVDAALGGTE
jgi:hypothetical protein